MKSNKENETASNKNCHPEHFIDESFRADDNSNYSPTAIEENACLDEPDVPGIGLEDQTAIEGQKPKSKKH